MATNIYFNTAAQDPQNAVCLSPVNTGPTSVLTMVLGSKIPINLYFVDGSGDYDPISGDSAYSVKVGIGKVGATSTGGTYTLTYGANTTSALAYNASAATVQTALNLLASIISAGGVTVSGTWPVLTVVFNSVGVRTALTGTQDSLTPTSALLIDEFQVGDASTVSKWGIENAVSPPVYQTSWSTITNGWTAVLDLETFELATLLAGVNAATLYFEVRVTDSDGNARVWGQPVMLVRNRVINPGSLAPAARDSYLTAAEVRDGFVQNRYLLSGLTGGTSSDLDSIPTAGAVATEGWMAAVVVSNSVGFYRLESSTHAESSPDWIRPDDYNGTTNQRVWHLVSLINGTEFTNLGSVSSASSALANPTNGKSISVYKIALGVGSGAYAWQLQFASATYNAGHTILITADIPASNGTFQILNDRGMGGTDLWSWGPDPSGVATTVTIELYSDGTDWHLYAASRAVDYTTEYIRRGTLSASARMLVSNSTLGGDTAKIAVASNTSSPNGTVNVTSLTSAESSTNADFAIVPKGTGAILAQVPDGTSARGNKRGANAVDLQTLRSGASQVASGGAAIAIGQQNTASGDNSIAIGYTGTASGQYSMALGRNSVASAIGTTAIGYGAISSLTNQVAISGSNVSSTSSQMSFYPTANKTTNATPVELFLDGFGNTDAKLVLSNSATWTFEILVTAYCVASGESEGFRFFGLIHRGANAAATAIVGTVVKEKVSTTAWDFDVDADTTNGSLRLKATGESGKTVLWNASVRTSEIN